ncbi:L-lactate dehydrogenase [Levilactobacillus bambusae]|uniref:L-lactate dehydrogenase n=1 Tax=Levilactobacillus bambusae TaxID=2024736 RepID=A0A2V1N572_9LACO|nr:L-lactate dehydrogenase [Levilactobacillus bambusae]PWG00840.1 L-lactate dehydrogenase [Levilactobacillus bambusae]
MTHKKVILAGDGAVGSSFAFSAIQQHLVDELVIVDTKPGKSNGDSLDLEDVTAFNGNVDVHGGSYSEASDADIAVITAGVPRKPGESRLDLVNKNMTILKAIVEPIVQSGFHGIFLVSANPVDVLTTATAKLSGFPKNRIIGTGTSLDSARLQVALAHTLGVSVLEVNAYVLGEHGDSEFAAYDEATVKDQPLRKYAVDHGITNADLDQIEADVRTKGGQIISQKGATFYGVATSLATLTKAIFNNENLVLSVGTALDGEYGISGVYCGSPAIINRNGATTLTMPLSDSELEKMQNSAAMLKQIVEQAAI